MAVKTYYGTCITAANQQEKEVVIQDLEVQSPDFTFNTGDLLVVYFTDTNNKAEPYLVISNGDTENEVSIETDTGKAIKTKSIRTDATVSAWDAGETVIFAYTHNTGNNDNDYYWELVNGAPSTENVYGVTKLYGNRETNISEWLGAELKDDDFTKALTPGILKKAYQELTGREGKSNPFNLGLTWTPGATAAEMVKLGTLSLDSDSNYGVDIMYPLTAAGGGDTVGKTSDLINDGPDPTKANLTEDGRFYLTNILPENKNLYYNNGLVNRLFLMPNTTDGNLHLRGQNGITLNASDENGNRADVGVGLVYCRPKFRSLSDATIDGNMTVKKGITCNGLTLKGNGSATGNFIVDGQLKGKELFENGTSIHKKYSGKLVRKVISTGIISMAKGGWSGHKYLNVGLAGHFPIAVAGFNINYADAKATGDPTWCFLWECHLINASTKPQIEYSVRNVKNGAVKIKINFDVLYVKNV